MVAKSHSLLLPPVVRTSLGASEVDGALSRPASAATPLPPWSADAHLRVAGQLGADAGRGVAEAWCLLLCQPQQPLAFAAMSKSTPGSPLPAPGPGTGRVSSGRRRASPLQGPGPAPPGLETGWPATHGSGGFHRGRRPGGPTASHRQESKAGTHHRARGRGRRLEPTGPAPRRRAGAPFSRGGGGLPRSLRMWWQRWDLTMTPREHTALAGSSGASFPPPRGNPDTCSSLCACVTRLPPRHHQPPKEPGAAPGPEPPGRSVHRALGDRSPRSHLGTGFRSSFRHTSPCGLTASFMNLAWTQQLGRARHHCRVME